MGAREPLLDEVCKAGFLHASSLGCEAKNRKFRKAVKAVDFARLGRQLQERTFRYGAVRSLEIAKANGKKRTIHVLEPEDWVVQRALAKCITTRLIAAGFSSACHAIPSSGQNNARGCHVAVRSVASLRRESHRVLKGDFHDFYPSVACHAAGDRICKLADDRSLEWILLDSPWVPDADSTCESNRYLLQGAPLSPLLASVYASDFDAAIERTGAGIVRYVDDFIVAAAPQADISLEFVKRRLPTGLTLNQDKSGVVGEEEVLVFLGFEVSPLGHISIPACEIEHLTERLANLHWGSQREREEIVQVMIGWWKYYQMGAADEHVSRDIGERVASALRRAGLGRVRGQSSLSMEQLCSEVKSRVRNIRKKV